MVFITVIILGNEISDWISNPDGVGISLHANAPGNDMNPFVLSNSYEYIIG